MGNTPMKRPLSIILVDDHALVREAVRARLDAEVDLNVVGATSNADDAVSLALELRPDIIVMDIDMPGLLCFDAARTIGRALPGTRVIFLSGGDRQDGDR